MTHQQFLDEVRSRVDELTSIAEQYPEAYPQALQQHEQELIRLSGLVNTPVRGFSALPPQPGYRQVNTSIPKAITDAFNQLYLSKSKLIEADYKAALTALKKAHDDSVRQVNQAINDARRAKDVNLVSQLRGTLININKAYQDGLKQAGLARQNAYQNLQVSMQQMLTASPYTPVSSTATTAGNVAPTTPNYPPPASQTVYVQGSNSNTPPSYPNDQGYNQATPVTSNDDWFGNLMNLLFGGLLGNQTPDNTAKLPVNQSYITPNQPAPVALPADTDQLDVFAPDAWNFSANPMIGNSTIQRINQLPFFPARSYGFSQWAALASAVIQAGAQVGAAALAPKVGSGGGSSGGLSANQMAALMTQQQQTKTDYTPIIIGVAAVAGLGLILATNRRKK